MHINGVAIHDQSERLKKMFHRTAVHGMLLQHAPWRLAFMGKLHHPATLLEVSAGLSPPSQQPCQQQIRFH